MTDEVKAALEWWRETSWRYTDAIGSDDKLALIADAYAAEHPEDDDKLRNTLREIEAHTENRANNVPIGPQVSQCSHEWEWTREVVDGEQTAYCNKCGEEYVYSNEPIHCAMNTPQTLNGAIVTIRRKLEAGGYAEPEVAIYLDGRYYSTEWIKSGVGVLPQQVEIV